MGICVTTARNGLINDREVVINSSSFGSWPKNLNDSQRFLRTQQTRTMSEPIMIANGKPFSREGPLESSSSGPGPPRALSLSFARKVVPVDLRDIPNVPFVFILGGPGSGKITHCERMTDEIEGLIHLNMQSIFLSIASEIGSRDPNIVPAYKALEALISQMVGIKNAIALLVTGYPRNMRDVVEYTARVQRVDGVILLDWSDRSLERQIQFGARMGEIDADLARFEMNNYRANIIPVAQFFDQQGLLHIVAGQRAPGEIYDDLKEEVNGIVGQVANVPSITAETKNQPINGVERTDSSSSQQRTKVVVHIPANENNAERKKSVDSVDLMIAEEINHIINDHTVEKSLPVVKENERENLENIVNV